MPLPKNTLVAGDLVAGLEPAESVEIQRILPFGGRILVEGVGVLSRRQIRRPLSSEAFAALVKIRGKDFTFTGDSTQFLLGVEAERIRIAHQFDPLFAVNSSIVDVLPHQVEAVYRYLLPLPRIRFLLADDTGAGKTIMAGLLIKELLFRGVISKVLIITPGGLTKQWQEDEMRDKFSLNFRLVNRASFDSEPAMFASEQGFFITSIDFIARHEVCLKSASETQWDMIIVDEAHKLSAYEYGTKIDRSARYQVVETLAPHTDHLLLLTATPHRGRKDTFRRLLMLIDDDLFQKDSLVTKRIHDAIATYAGVGEEFQSETAITKARNRFFLRRLKEEMTDWSSRPLFKPRYTQTVGYELTPEELELYDEVTQYVRSRRREAKAKKNRNVELTLMVMQRRLASSIYAITRTLENRLRALDEILAILRDPALTNAEKNRMLRGDVQDVPTDIGEYEELDENQRKDIDRRIFRQVLSAKPEDVEDERNEVDRLLKKALALHHHVEAKFNELLTVLDSSDVIRRDEEKLVIFTEHRDTMDNLAERLRNKGYSVAVIHGDMDVDQRKQAQRDFRLRAKIMVATDAAGEGINLQFCRYLINWDIPWNPNRLEQRMGRIHRYGQKDDVYVYNLVAVNTREGSVLQRVLSKLDIMREQMGTDRVYDVIDEMLEDVPLVKLIEKSIDEASASEAAETVDAALGPDFRAKADALVALQKKQSLASHLDLRDAQELRDASDERRLQPCFIQRFFAAAYQAAGGSIVEDKHFPVFHVGRVPSGVIDAAREHRTSLPEKYETPFVFDKTLVSVASKIRIPENTRLLGPGHPLFEGVIEWAKRGARDAFARGAHLIDPNVSELSRIWLVRTEVKDTRGDEKIRKAHEQLSIIVESKEGLSSTSPASLLSCVAPQDPLLASAIEPRPAEEIQVWAYEHITEPQTERVREQRRIECDLRRNYLTTTFTELILDLQDELNTLQQGQLFGEDDSDKRGKLELRIAALKARKVARLAELDQMMLLQADLPVVITSAMIHPAPTAPTAAGKPKKGVPMRRDDEIEAVAMQAAMNYERGRGWKPFDVSKDGEHYDIRSEGPNGEKRFIEVKGRAQTGDLVLTGPELDKLRQLGDRAWLYIATFCKDADPRLRIINDPIAKLNPELLYRQIQFLINEEDWTGQGEEILQTPKDTL